VVKDKRSSKKTETLRERTERTSNAAPKSRRLQATASKLGKPVHAARKVGRKEFHLPMPDNRFGRILSKRIRFMPRFFKDAWKELRLVEWPNARMTMRLTFAVFVFSVVFGAIITAVDYGLDKVFRKVFL
jgi:preprotein translocase SecE subunit